MAAAAERPRLAARLIAWARANGRHGLPWQCPATPYRVWVSEIMLQQTQVATVIPYFERFTARFPNLTALADADIGEVLGLWAGLGYYARARNLHAAARRCRDEHVSGLPDSPEALTALPGIGRSTAGAILALGFGRHAAILDGNAKRVLARYHAVDGWPGANGVSRELWRIAESETPQREVGAYTQAIMDLGATVCTRAAPDCGHCPLAGDCAALAAGAPMRYPAPRPRRIRPIRERHFAWIERQDKLLFEVRPPAGVWGGLLCLPERQDNDGDNRHDEGAELHLRRLQEMPGFSHELTHFRLVASVTAYEAIANNIGDGERFRWLSREAAVHGGLPAPIKAYVKTHFTDDRAGVCQRRSVSPPSPNPQRLENQ